MGRAAKWRVQHLPRKLREIRLKLGLSQTEMVRALRLEHQVYRSNISSFETGEREPALPILLAYARLAEVPVDALIDDSVENLRG
jgi:transcriptional regulator with XRE-family HTH domain